MAFRQNLAYFFDRRCSAVVAGDLLPQGPMKSCLRVLRPLVALDHHDQALCSILDTDWAQARAVSGMKAGGRIY